MKIFTRRFGSHFGYTYGRNKAKLRMLLLLTIVFIIVTSVLFTLRSHFLPLVTSMAQSKAKSIGTAIINEAITMQLTSKDVDYSQLYEIQKNKEGEISAIVANVTMMNTIKSQLNTSIQDRINSIDTQQIGIPIGSMLNNELLAGRGPKIPIKIVTVGEIQIDFTNSFVSAGINQTKHEVHLEVKASISAMMPTGNIVSDVTSTIPVAQTIIVGKVPDTYTNIAF